MNAVAARRLALALAADLLADESVLAGVELEAGDRGRVRDALVTLAGQLRRRLEPKPKREPAPAPRPAGTSAPVADATPATTPTAPWRAAVACIDGEVWLRPRGRRAGWMSPAEPDRQAVADQRRPWRRVWWRPAAALLLLAFGLLVGLLVGCGDPPSPRAANYSHNVRHLADAPTRRIWPVTAGLT